MAVGSWISGFFGSQTQTATTTTNGSNSMVWPGHLYSTSTAINIPFNQSPWTVPESLDDKQIKSARRLLAIRDLTEEQLADTAEAIAEHAKVDVAAAKAALAVIKSIIVLGELEDKLDARDEQLELPSMSTASVTYTYSNTP